MNSTALGAGNTKKENIIFISEAHEKFYYEKLKEVRYQDAYHKALVYCLGISEDTRRNVYNIYDFKTGCVKTECLHEGWQTSGSVRVVRMAFNLYCNGTPSVYDYEDAEEQLSECKLYSVEDLFCFGYALFLWQAIQIRYKLLNFLKEEEISITELARLSRVPERKILDIMAGIREPEFECMCKIADALGICVHELRADEEHYAVAVQKDTLAKLIVVSEINGVELEELIHTILEKGIEEHGFYR